MKSTIVGFHRDDNNEWVAELACGHLRHVRHQPPFVSHPWIASQSGRSSMLGGELDCTRCDTPDGDDGHPPGAAD